MKYSICSFIDVLGYSDMVIRDCRDSMQKFTNKSILKSLLKSMQKEIGRENAIIFSDSIISFYEYSWVGLQVAVNVSKYIQESLLSERIFCRGGIAHGRHEMDDGFIFSEALIESYNIESKLAVYPRIIISSDLYELLMLRESSLLRSVKVDFDRQMFVDYSEKARSEEGYAFSSFLKGNISNQTPASVAMKWHWFVRFVEDLPQAS